MPATPNPFIEDIARVARGLRVPMTHDTHEPEFMPVLTYRVGQEIAAAERRLTELKALRDSIESRERIDAYTAR